MSRTAGLDCRLADPSSRCPLTYRTAARTSMQTTSSRSFSTESAKSSLRANSPGAVTRWRRRPVEPSSVDFPGACTGMKGMHGVQRRDFLIATGALLATPLAAEAQPTAKVYRIGYLSAGAASQGVSGPFRGALKELGYIEGRNLVIESRFADTKMDELPGLAKDLVRVGVDIIVPIGNPTVQAAKEATATIPIVMAGSADPVEHKFVVSLGRPGGNVTGVTHSPGPEISAKGLQLLKE